MALILAFQNISKLAPTSDYKVTVYINETVIDVGKVTGHARADGYKALVRKFLEQNPEQK